MWDSNCCTSWLSEDLRNADDFNVEKSDLYAYRVMFAWVIKTKIWVLNFKPILDRISKTGLKTTTTIPIGMLSYFPI